MSNQNQHPGEPDYPSGPWTEEPDRVEFEHAGFPCILARGSIGSWCGYVAVPPGHPWHGQEMSGLWDSDLRVHGGITYANECQGHVCHVPKSGEPDNVWWLGFDCAHAFDLTPGAALYEHLRNALAHIVAPGPFAAQYRDVAYATNETKLLAEQAKVAAG